MTSHLSDADLGAFRAGTLAADAVLRVDDHLTSCAECRTRAAVLGGDAAVDVLHAELAGPTDHLSDEDLQQFVQGRMRPDAAAAAARHVEICETCASQVDDLRGWAAQRSPAWPRRLALAAAILLMALVPAAIWEARRVQTPASVIVAFDTLSPAAQARIREALKAGAGDVPPFMNDLAASREVLMGPAPAPAESFRALDPVGTATLSDRPQFRWEPLTGAIDYVVSVFDERANLVVQSPRLAAAAWTADPLPRGSTYAWQVTARRADGETTTPVAPAPRAAFHVVDADSAAELQRLEKEQPQAHLVMGILYMDAGVVGAAMDHLRAVPATDANADVARRSLQKLAAPANNGPARRD